ncbi:multidrug transporter [Kordiimonas sediminis]|uniref:Multidrug transporter n=1 Tax=Kordiimonas sediminis TaxID=1735581 RepID=A0A919ASL4_9PROT|nr:efflux RND transporter periplasmic adaptor subunit [Kordiimonas sediminis]GHF23037.1 multidrug transporter [Kordiimonas sediminis]
MQISRKHLIGGAITLCLGILITVRLGASPQTEETAPKPLPVKTVTAHLQDTYQVRRSFTGRAIARRESHLSFELGGTLKSVAVDFGSTVQKGDVLASLDTSRLEAQLNQMLAEQEEIAATLRLAERTLSRTQETFKRGHTSAQRLDEAEANMISLQAQERRLAAAVNAVRIDLGKHTLTAPYDGVITSRTADEGSVLAAGTPLLQIVEASVIEAHIGMPADFASASALADQVKLYTASRQQITDFKIKSVVPTLSGQTRTMLVTFELPAGAAKHGELIHAVIDDTLQSTGAWLPLRAVSSDVRGLWRVYKVFEDEKGHYVRFENIQIIYTDKERVFVTGTISDGDIIISNGMDRLAPRQRVRIVSSDPSPQD